MTDEQRLVEIAHETAHFVTKAIETLSIGSMSKHKTRELLIVAENLRNLLDRHFKESNTISLG